MARRDWLEAGVIAVAIGLLYAATAARTVALEDDGLFVLGAYYLGIGHPPGYPLFMLIGKLFTYLPFGSVAYRVHLVSAFFGGLTCGGVWLCARQLAPGRLPAYLAAIGLGLSPVFWSQATIAEVYTLNTFFFVTLILLILRGAPLVVIAFVYGLSLSNHWPLMGLVTPAFFALLWPRRVELVRRLPLLILVAVLGLAPYAWMVVRSWSWIPISYNGPLESFQEFWFVLSRKGYAHVDTSVSASWLDRIKFFEFMAGQVFYQFAIVGTLIAVVGCALQRRLLGIPKALFLTIAFLMPSFVLLLMLRFDYDAIYKHVFHVYPLPAYVIAALWMAIGFAWLATRYELRQRHALASCLAALALIGVVGARANMFTDEEWGARYAKTVLSILPKDAVLFVRGDVDLAPIAYFYLVEGWRPDIELYHSAGRVLGNRLFLPLRTTPEEAQAIIRNFIESRKVPVTFTMETYSAYASRDHWLYMEVDKSSRDARRVSIDIPEEAVRFFEDSIATVHEPNAWVAFHQDELRRRYGVLLGEKWPRRGEPDGRMLRHRALLTTNYFGAIGLAEGLMSNKDGYSVSEVNGLLERGAALMPSDANKSHKSRYFYVRGALRLDLGDKEGAIRDFRTSLEVWSSPENPAARPLKDLLQAQP